MGNIKLGVVSRMKNQKQFQKVLENSTKGKENCFSVMLEKEKATLFGFEDGPIVLASAVLILRDQKNFFVSGFLDSKKCSYSTNTLSSFTGPLVVAFDLSKPQNQIIYVSTSDNLLKFDARSNDHLDKSLSLFCDTGNYAFLAVGEYDSAIEEVIRQVISGSADSLRKFLKAETLQKLNAYMRIIEDSVRQATIEDNKNETISSSKEVSAHEFLQRNTALDK